MLKHLTLLSIASVLTLTTGCLITTGDTSDTATSTATDTDTTTEGTTAGTTTMGTTTMGTTTTGTASDSMTSTATDATTMGTTEDTTTAGTTSQESTSTTDGTTTEDTTTGAEPGCGWNDDRGAQFYDCSPFGEPGVEDPMGLDPLACPDQKLAVGEPCVDVKELGCCDADQNLWYCDNGSLVFQMCVP